MTHAMKTRQFTTIDFKEATQVALNIMNRAKVKSLQINDVVNHSFENGVFVFPKMTDYVLHEKRRNKISLPETNICSCCKQIKTQCEFYVRTDYRTNHTYLIQPCINCHKIKYKNDRGL